MNWKILISTIGCYVLYLALYFVAVGVPSNLGGIVVVQDVILIIYWIIVGFSLRQQRRSRMVASQDNKIILMGILLYFFTPIGMYAAFANSTAGYWLAVVGSCFIAYSAILLAYTYYRIKKIRKQGVTEKGNTAVRPPSVKKAEILHVLSGCFGILAILLPANMSSDEGAWIWGLYYPGPHTFLDFLWNYEGTWFFVFMLLLSTAIVGSLFTIFATLQSDKLRRLRPGKTGPIITIGTWIAYLIIALTVSFDGVIFGWAPFPVGSIIGLLAGILGFLPK